MYFSFQNYVESPRRENNVESSRYSEMVRDAFGTHSGAQNEPNDEDKNFYEQLKEASHPFYEDQCILSFLLSFGY